MSETQFAYFCPQCSGARVDVTAIADSGACRDCGWQGARAELLHMPMGKEASPEKLITQILHDIANTFAKDYAQSFGRVLMSWGFLDPDFLNEELRLYVSNASRAVLASVIRTRELLEVERKKRKESVKGTLS